MHKRIIIILLFLQVSCSPFLIAPSIKNGLEISIRVEKHGDAWTDQSEYYIANITKNGEAYILKVTKGESTTIYQLPPNKLILLSEMENSFQDLHQRIALSYYLIVIKADYKTKYYKINTDIVRDFITGLKK